MPLAFFVHDAEIVASLEKTLAGQSVETEKVLDIIYQPQAVFRVRAVTRCTSSLEGHTEAVISVAFSPTGKYEGLASGGAWGEAVAAVRPLPRDTALSWAFPPLPGTWRAALETPLSASGTSARRRRSSRPKVGAGVSQEGSSCSPLPQGPPARSGGTGTNRAEPGCCLSCTGWPRGSGRD